MNAKVITIYNNKGGVGKTHLCVNLASIFGYLFQLKTLLIDLDPQANASHFLLKDKSSYSKTVSDILSDDTISASEIIYSTEIPNLDIIPTSPDLDDSEAIMLLSMHNDNDEMQKLKLKNIINQLKSQYDIIVIDTHPSKKRLLNLNALCASDFFACPTDSDPESFEGLNGLIETYNDILPLNPNLRFLGVIYMKFRNTNADFKALYSLSESLVSDGLLFNTYIPLRTKAVEVRWLKTPLILYAPNDDCTKAYIDLANEMLNKMEIK